VNNIIASRYDKAERKYLSNMNNARTTVERARIQKNDKYPNIWKKESSGRSVNLHIAEPVEIATVINANKYVKIPRLDLSFFIIL